MANSSSALTKPLSFILKDFSAGFEEDEIQIDPNAIYCVSDTTLPIPGLALYVLVRKLNCYYYGPDDSQYGKIHWAVLFRHKDKSYALELRKFGLRLVGSFAPTEKEAKDILSALAKATQYVEAEVRELAKERIAEGRITVPNRLEEFSEAFEFFTKKAQETYTRFSEDRKQALDQNNYQKLSDASLVKQEASYYASAAIEAFYSRLEHILILVRPFVEPRLSGEKIKEFMADNWGDKFNKTFSPSSNQQANRIKSMLTKTKEKYRNPAAHGGFVKDGAALYFHDPLMGAQPVKLSKEDELPILTLCGITENDFIIALEHFKEFERFLEKSEARYGYLYVKSGLDVCYDDNSIDLYLYSSSDEYFDKFLEASIWMDDCIRNADY